MITVSEAQALCLERLVPLDTEVVQLAEAAGRVLRAPVTAARAQPPFAASAMDGYAVRGSDVRVGATFDVVGAAPAGHAWQGKLAPGEALRIFTGAPMPNGADYVVIQEDTTRSSDTILLLDTLGSGPNVRPAGADFGVGHTVSAPRILRAPELALLAAMNAGEVTVTRRPCVHLIATGDELVMPGGAPRDDQIVASNVFALKAMIESAGGTAKILPIAPDTEEAIAQTFALTDAADLIVTIGGASVGDHDLVGKVAANLGLDRAFYKVAMRPGKPLMSGTLIGKAFLGLPGNPVSAIVCGHLFLVPMIRQFLGLTDVLPQTVNARLVAALPANGPRAHYMRAHIKTGVEGFEIEAFDRQDSSLLTVLSVANALLVHPANKAALPPGSTVQAILM